MNRDRLPVDRRTREQSSFLKKRHTERPKKLEAGFFLSLFFFSEILIREKCGLWIAYIQSSRIRNAIFRIHIFVLRKQKRVGERASERASERERERERETRLRENETLKIFDDKIIYFLAVRIILFNIFEII